MIKVLGKFEALDNKQILTFELNKKNFDLLKDHISKNMFFSYMKGVQAGTKKILLSSIGDHLDSLDEQDVTKADICIDITVKEKMTSEQLDQLDNWHTWAIHIKCGNESLSFAIDKETEFIKKRAYNAG